MKRRQHLHGKNLGLLPTQLSRRDFLSAQMVEIGIVIQQVQGTEQAAQYLMSKKVDLEVAVRVLAHPARRRTWTELANPESTAQRSW